MSDSISDKIEQAALGPKSVTVAGQTTVARDMDELIKADQHTKAKQAGSKSHLGLRFSQIVPPGAG